MSRLNCITELIPGILFSGIGIAGLILLHADGPGILLFGILFTAAGSLILLRAIAGIRRISTAEKHGTKVMAEVVSCRIDFSISLNGISPYVLECSWQNPATGEVCHFCSDPIFRNLSSVLPGTEVEVMVDPENPEIYAVHWQTVLERRRGTGQAETWQNG